MSEISGGNTIENAATIFTAVLQNESTAAQKQVVCANAAIAIDTVKGIGIKEAYAEAVESIESGAAFKVFKQLQELS